MIKKYLKHIYYFLKGQTINLTVQVDLNAEWYGNSYGGFYIYPEVLDKESIIYSFGIGEDISFDLALIDKYKCQVFAFDPTPKSINWVNNQTLPTNFHFSPYGLSNKSGFETFYLPKNTEYVSGSTIGLKNVNTLAPIEVPMKSMVDIIKEHKTTVIDVLKMDIEGSEYLVLEDILNVNVEIKQICIEFHHRMMNNGKQKTLEAIQLLKSKDFLLFKFSDSGEELSFIKKDYLK